MKMLLCLIVIIFGMTGCASLFKKEPPVVTTITVEVPVPVVCNLDVKKPEDKLVTLQPSTSILTKGNALLDEVMHWRVYGTQVEAGMKACTDVVEATKKKDKK